MKALDHAIKLREEGNVKESNSILKALVEDYPDVAEINYQLAWSYDVLGLEHEAIPYYEKAIALGLPERDQIEAIIGLGSTYRTVGQYNKSKQLLESSTNRYKNRALDVFLAMTYYNLKEHEKAVSSLLKLLAETSSDQEIQKFSRAIKYYSERLNETE
jgi:tetratricopeptide (TPR) repeat protein